MVPVIPGPTLASPSRHLEAESSPRQALALPNLLGRGFWRCKTASFVSSESRHRRSLHSLSARGRPTFDSRVCLEPPLRLFPQKALDCRLCARKTSWELAHLLNGKPPDNSNLSICALVSKASFKVSLPARMLSTYMFSLTASAPRGKRCSSSRASWCMVRIARYGTDVVP